MCKITAFVLKFLCYYKCPVGSHNNKVKYDGCLNVAVTSRQYPLAMKKCAWASTLTLPFFSLVKTFSGTHKLQRICSQKVAGGDWLHTLLVRFKDTLLLHVFHCSLQLEGEESRQQAQLAQEECHVLNTRLSQAMQTHRVKTNTHVCIVIRAYVYRVC